MKHTKNSDMVDLIKFIGAIMIFVMHTNALGDYKYASFLWECCSRWAVPFFFIVSSFFLCKKIYDVKKLDEKKVIVMNYTKRLLILYGLWGIFNIPSIVYTRLISPGLFFRSTWITFIKSMLISSTFTGSWFLTSCVFSAWFVFYVLGNIDIKIKLIMTGVVQLICIFCSSYMGVAPELIEKIFHRDLFFPLNIFVGVFYYTVGEMIYINWEKIERIKRSLFVIGVVLFMSSFFCEILVTKVLGILYTTDCTFFLAPFSACIVILSLRSQKSIRNHSGLRKNSTIIYCGQSNILLASSLLCNSSINYFLNRFIISVALLIPLCFFVIKTQKRIKWVGFLT